ncbi:S-type pyocin domain-containing protein [Pseudomonas sp. PCH446]
MSRGTANGRGQGLHGDLTTTGAVCISSLPKAAQGRRGVLRLGDVTTACKKCGETGAIVESLPAMRWLGIPTVLDGAEVRCGCPPGTNRLIAPVERPSRAARSEPISEAPQPHGAPHLNPTVPGATPGSSQTCVFAKSCVSVPAGSTDAGTVAEPADNFGATALLASTGTAGTLGRIAGTLGRDLGAWAVRGFSGAAAGASPALNVVLLAFWPRAIGDSTLYTPEQLANMRSASTRVRFQFRYDDAGKMRVYGLHTRPGNGADRVPVTQARWNIGESAMVADLDGISITWTPNNGPVVNVPTPYPGTSERLDNLLVHPIPVGQETQLTHYPDRTPRI